MGSDTEMKEGTETKSHGDTETQRKFNLSVSVSSRTSVS